MPAPNSVTINGVPCTLYFGDSESGNIVESVGAEGLQATVILQCAYADRVAVYVGLLGSTTFVGTKLFHTPPFAYPPIPRAKCVAITRAIGIKPRWDPALGWATFEKAQIEVAFAIPTWQSEGAEATDPSGLAYTTTKFRVSAEVFTPPGGAYYFPALGGTPVEESTVGIVRSRVEISMTRHKFPFVPLDTIMFYAGSVNDEPIQFADRLFPRGCLLFLCANTDPQADPVTGATTQEVEFSFLGNWELEWNEFFARNGEWHLINTEPDGSGRPPFRYEDFSVFFGDDFPHREIGEPEEPT